MDRTRARCSIEVGIDQKTSLPESILMTVLIGRRNEHGRTAKGDAAFSDGVEHIVFSYEYKLDTDKETEPMDLPDRVKRMLK